MISVNGSVLLNYLKTTKGISSVGAHADGRIDCSWASTGDSIFTVRILGVICITPPVGSNSTGLALNCATAKIKGSAYLRSYLPPKGSAWHFRTYGEVTFYGAKSRANLNARAVILDRERTSAQSRAARVDGALFLNQLMENGGYGPRFTSKGKVTLTAAKIGLNLQCEGGCFINRGGIALDCGGIDVRLAVYLSKPDEPEEWSKEHNVTDDMHGKPFISKGRVISARPGSASTCIAREVNSRIQPQTRRRHRRLKWPSI